MPEFLNKLFTLLILGVLVAIFVSIEKHRRSARVRLWLIGWGLTFLHFSLGMVMPVFAASGHLLQSLNLLVWLGSAVVFMVSVSGASDSSEHRWAPLVIAGVPAAVFAILMPYGAVPAWVLAGCGGASLFGGAIWMINWYRKPSFYLVTGVVVLSCAGVYCIARALDRQLFDAFYVMLAIFVGFTGVLFWRRFARWTPGPFATTAGFLAWSASFPFAHFVQHLGAEQVMWNELWQMPKFFVAFGMIVTLLEQETLSTRAARDLASTLNQQMQRFAEITSRLLSGVDARTLCPDVAVIISQATNFERVVIVLADDDHRLYIAGHAGLEVESVVGQAIPHSTVDTIREVCAHGTRIGQNSYRIPWKVLEQYGALMTDREFPEHANWQRGDEIIVPLRTPRGAVVGSITLDNPRDLTRITAEEMSAIEMLAADIAVAVENVTLQHQLVVTEKLAGMGRLVAGVAHELNNPLTAVLGYSELLHERVKQSGLEREFGILHREALRMKRIIDNLLRFAQQNRAERRPVNISQTLQDVLLLRAYEGRNRGVDIKVDVAADLPPIFADEDQLKQVFFNLLNNALDAVQSMEEKRIVIEGSANADKLVLRFMDTGPGFIDVNRIFDPFYTTKAPGKGTGLGLSICYGILKQHGGHIHAYNLHPHGGCISLEFPLKTTASEQAIATTAG
jgi:two-component system, NtrC family, sensor kinase